MIENDQASTGVIKSFLHKGIEKFFRTKSKAGIQAAHADRINRQLAALDAATKPEQMNLPGWDFHQLTGKDKGTWSVSVNGNWRITFKFEGEDAVLVDYLDYH
jgi:proteic killer suppression protein